MTAYITADNCTEAIVSPIIASIKADVADAIVDIKALGGLGVDAIVGANVTVDVVAGLVADLIIVRILSFLIIPKCKPKCPLRRQTSL